MLKFFKECKNLEDVKETYRKLAFLHHPDMGGDPEIMKAVNSEYETAFKQFKNIHRTAEGKTYEKPGENTETAADFKDIIDKIITFTGIKIELIGSWIWISGETFKYKNELKNLKFTWCSTKKMWSYHHEGDNKKSHKKFDIEQIRSMFGSEEIKTKNPILLNWFLFYAIE